MQNSKMKTTTTSAYTQTDVTEGNRLNRTRTVRRTFEDGSFLAVFVKCQRGHYSTIGQLHGTSTGGSLIVEYSYSDLYRALSSMTDVRDEWLKTGEKPRR